MEVKQPGHEANYLHLEPTLIMRRYVPPFPILILSNASNCFGHETCGSTDTPSTLCVYGTALDFSLFLYNGPSHLSTAEPFVV
jgi:hypothetical protein